MECDSQLFGPGHSQTCLNIEAQNPQNLSDCRQCSLHNVIHSRYHLPGLNHDPIIPCSILSYNYLIKVRMRASQKKNLRTDSFHVMSLTFGECSFCTQTYIHIHKSNRKQEKFISLGKKNPTQHDKFCSFEKLLNGRWLFFLKRELFHQTKPAHQSLVKGFPIFHTLSAIVNRYVNSNKVAFCFNLTEEENI